MNMEGGHGKIRRADLLLLGIAAGLVLFGLMFLDEYVRNKPQRTGMLDRAGMVRSLMLTDLCLFTEARYARHLSQADIHSAFQDHPRSAEHFPAGSFTRPPKGIRTLHEKVD